MALSGKLAPSGGCFRTLLDLRAMTTSIDVLIIVQVETLLRRIYGPALEQVKPDVLCYLSAVCIRHWQEAGCSSDELVARATAKMAQQLQATGRLLCTLLCTKVCGQLCQLRTLLCH